MEEQTEITNEVMAIETTEEMRSEILETENAADARKTSGPFLERDLIAKVKSSYERLHLTGGQSIEAFIDLGRNLNELAEAKENPKRSMFHRFLKSVIPEVDPKTAKQAMIFEEIVDLETRPDFRYLPRKKVWTLITLVGKRPLDAVLDAHEINATLVSSGDCTAELFHYQIDNLIEDLRAEKAAAEPKKSEILALGKTADRFAKKMVRVLNGDTPMTEEENQEVSRIENIIFGLLEAVQTHTKASEVTMASRL